MPRYNVRIEFDADNEEDALATAEGFLDSGDAMGGRASVVWPYSIRKSPD